MQTENLILDDSSQWQVVKKFSENLPYVCITVLAETLIIETIPVS